MHTWIAGLDHSQSNEGLPVSLHCLPRRSEDRCPLTERQGSLLMLILRGYQNAEKTPSCEVRFFWNEPIGQAKIALCWDIDAPTIADMIADCYS